MFYSCQLFFMKTDGLKKQEEESQIGGCRIDKSEGVVKGHYLCRNALQQKREGVPNWG
jgi:hypothetical protein